MEPAVERVVVAALSDAAVSVSDLEQLGDRLAGGGQRQPLGQEVIAGGHPASASSLASASSISSSETISGGSSRIVAGPVAFVTSRCSISARRAS